MSCPKEKYGQALEQEDVIFIGKFANLYIYLQELNKNDVQLEC